MKKQTYNNYMNAEQRMSECVQAHPYIFHLSLEQESPIAKYGVNTRVVCNVKSRH